MQDIPASHCSKTAITLVLLPGMEGTGTLFAPFAELMEQHCLVKVIDYPCSIPLGYAELEALVRTQLPEGKPFVILGESFSGPIAISIAASAPPGFRGLILSCTFVRNPRPTLASLKPFVKLLPVSAAPMVLLDKVLLGEHSTPHLRFMINRALKQLSPDTIRTRIEAVLAVDASEKMAAISAPVLYLRASKDHVVPKSASRLVAQLQPGIRIVDFEAPHMLLQTCPQETAAEVMAFIHSLDGEIEA